MKWMDIFTKFSAYCNSSSSLLLLLLRSHIVIIVVVFVFCEMHTSKAFHTNFKSYSSRQWQLFTIILTLSTVFTICKKRKNKRQPIHASIEVTQTLFEIYSYTDFDSNNTKYVCSCGIRHRYSFPSSRKKRNQNRTNRIPFCGVLVW